MGSWAEDETAGCDLGDLRLNRRLGAMLASLGERPAKSLPTAFQDWANTTAAYRFFANENVSEDKILAGHSASALRVSATDGPILMLQDTTEFSVKRTAPEKIMDVALATMIVRRPIGKQKRYEHRQLQIIQAAEIDPPDHRDPLLWKPVTNLEVTSFGQAVQKLDGSARRWRIGTVFRTKKTGCRIEDIRLTTADRLASGCALACITAWRIFWMTRLGKTEPAGTPASVVIANELAVLDLTSPPPRGDQSRDFAFHRTAVARLGGSLARRQDPPPGTRSSGAVSPASQILSSASKPHDDPTTKLAGN